jgi:quinohemoprotein ethanol dehydrogenase
MLLAACARSPGSGDWLTGGRDFRQSYYSPLTLIDKTNVTGLGFAWQYEVEATEGFESTPIVVNGSMFSSGPRGVVYSVDAKTGKERWVFRPDIDLSFIRRAASGNPANRGVAVSNGLVYVGSLDGYLYALDAESGAVRWKVDTFTDRERGYTLSGAPYIAKDVVVIGNAGGDADARGYITAYDLTSGRQQWRFFIVPGDPAKGFEHPELEVAAKTWDPNSPWEVGLGGTAWDGMAYDPELNLLYVGTGNGVPHPRKLRSPAGGDNLFLSSILAIDPDSGRLVWHYQTTPADNWDYTATQKMILADLEIRGRKRSVLMQAPKNGFFYVLDRKTGELLSAEPFVQVNWASHIDPETGRPVETGKADYSLEPKLVFPSLYGGHNWQPMSYSESTGLVYIPAIEEPAVFAMEEPFVYQKGGYNTSANYLFPLRDGLVSLWGESRRPKNMPSLEALTAGQPDYTTRGFLRAWDPVNQRLVWEKETSGDFVGHRFATWNGGGVMSTAAGLVFQGRGTGDLVILDAATGAELHSIDVGTSMTAAPMTYLLGGEQYVAIMAGAGGLHATSPPPGTAAYRYGNQGRIVAFKLGGGPVPHRAEIVRNQSGFVRPPVERRGSEPRIALGARLFERNCSRCHTNSGDGGIPDLRSMSKETHGEFLDVVLRGTRAQRGMVGFEGVLSAADAGAIHDYLIDLAWRTYEHKGRPNGVR